MVTSDQTYSRLLDGYLLQDVQVGLVKLQPDANLPESVEALRTALPSDVLVLTREQLNAKEKEYWAVKSSVGLICGFGTVVAIIVGVVILYQVLATDVANSLPQYATLKAMGYTDRSVAQIVLLKVCFLGIVAYVPSVLMALIAYALTRQLAKLLTVMTWERLVAVLALTLLMCTLTGVVCMRKLRSADPADLF
jgi:putative ABC transport system permease protein